ncbi:MAG: T9SS type A sorting domain-containing protein [Flavobacteriales bacterium]|nr:T9SS type A sorting domain-containing protein [Flavobacteriales bacterium]
MDLFSGHRMVRLFVVPASLAVAIGLNAQNLIPNPSFEEMDGSCEGGAYYGILADWVSPNCGGPGGYFHSCSGANGFPNANVPVNLWGAQDAAEGSAYLGITTYQHNSPLLLQSYPTVALEQALIAGVEYCMSIRINLAGRSAYRTRNLSVIFSWLYPSACGGNDTINWPTEAQIVFNTEAIDTTDWTVLAGSFTAIGGEQYLTMGDFIGFANPDTVFHGVTSAPVQRAVFFIDDLSLLACDAGVSDITRHPLNVYPNPASDRITIDLAQVNGPPYEYFLSDAAGRTVRSGSLASSSLDVKPLASGIYQLVLRSKGAVHTSRLVIQH